MGITYLFYQTLHQKQFILPFKSSGSDYLFRLNALLEQGTVALIRSFYKNFYGMFIKCLNDRLRRKKKIKTSLLE